MSGCSLSSSISSTSSDSPAWNASYTSSGVLYSPMQRTATRNGKNVGLPSETPVRYSDAVSTHSNHTIRTSYSLQSSRDSGHHSPGTRGFAILNQFTHIPGVVSVSLTRSVRLRCRLGLSRRGRRCGRVRIFIQIPLHRNADCIRNGLNLIAVIPRNLRRARPNKFIREFVRINASAKTRGNRLRKRLSEGIRESATVADVREQFERTPVLVFVDGDVHLPVPGFDALRRPGQRIGARALLRHRLRHGSCSSTVSSIDPISSRRCFWTSSCSANAEMPPNTSVICSMSCSAASDSSANSAF